MQSVTELKAEHPELAPFIDDICSVKARDAFSNSYSRPDIMGFQLQMEYAQRLVTELASVHDVINSAADRGATIIDTWESEVELWFTSFRKELLQRFNDYLAAESRCSSALLCGPGNFPTSQNQKHQALARARREDISEYCNMAVKGVLAMILPHGDGADIDSDEPDTISRPKGLGGDLLCRTFENGITVLVTDDKLLIIEFGYEPDADIRLLLGKHGFRLGPSRDGQAWVRELTTSAVFAYAQYVKPILESLPWCER